jgi:hypothetical protein
MMGRMDEGIVAQFEVLSAYFGRENRRNMFRIVYRPRFAPETHIIQSSIKISRQQIPPKRR